MRFFADSRRRWYLLAAAWVVLIVLGYGGFVEQSNDESLNRGFLDNLYLTLQLAVLSYGDEGSSLNWRLEIARFAAPLMATGTLIQAASVVFKEQFERYRLRYFRGHTVVAGLGASGTRLGARPARGGKKVAPSTRRCTAGRLGAEVPATSQLAGDPKDPANAPGSCASTGRPAWSPSCESDAMNVAIAAAARDMPRDQSGRSTCGCRCTSRTPS